MTLLETIVPGFIGFSPRKIVLRTAIFALVMSGQSAFAEINTLSGAENSNVAAAVNALKQLVADGLGENPNEAEKAQLDKIKQIYENLEAKARQGALKSVPGLADTESNKLEQYNAAGESTPLSSAKGAYCSDDTYVKNDKTGNMDQCRKGDILVDKALLDPGNGTPIDPATFEGWTQLQELTDILAHEKMHDIVITENVDVWRKREEKATEGAKRTPEQEAARAKQLAEDEKKIWWEGATVEKHKEVYVWQKIVVLWNGINLKHQRRQTAKQLAAGNKQLKPRLAKRDALARKLADQNKLVARAQGAKEKMAAKETPQQQADRTRRIDGLKTEAERLERELAKYDDIGSAEREMQKLSEHIEEFDKKINWLAERHKFLEGRMAKATASAQFQPWEKCGWPRRTPRGLLHVYLTAPGFYLRMDGVLARSRVTRAGIGEMAWLGSVEKERPIRGTPRSIIVLPLNVYTATQIQPDRCAYMKSATESGLIKTIGAGKLIGYLEAATGMALPEQRPQRRSKPKASRPRRVEQERETPRRQLDIGPLIEFGVGVGRHYMHRRDRQPQREDHRRRD